MAVTDNHTIRLEGGNKSAAEMGSHGDTQLLAAINHLTSSLSSFSSSFNTALKDFTNKTKQQSDGMLRIRENLSEARRANATDPQLKNISQVKSETSRINAATRATPEMIAATGIRAEGNFARNRAEEIRQKTAGRMLGVAEQYRSSGDFAGAKKIEDIVGRAITTGTNKGLESSKLRSLMGAVGAVGGIGLLSNTVGNVMKSNTQMGLSMMQNPILNGYDYGSTVGNVLNLNAQQKAGVLQTALTVGGGVVGSLGGVVGAGIGASVGGAAGQMLGAQSTGKAALQANALSTYINNYMNMEAMSGTNQAAGKLAKGSIGNAPLTNMEVPLIMTMAKGVAVYNNNFKAMDELTKYAKSAQLNLGQAGSLASNIGLASKDKSFNIQNMANLFSTYGISPDQYSDVFNKKIAFQQGGMHPEKALELAAKSSGLNPIVQGAMSSYYSQDMIQRNQKMFIAKTILGEDLEGMAANGNYSATASSRKRRTERATASGSLVTNPNDILANMLYTGGLYSVGESSMESRTLQQSRTSPSANQEKYFSTINNVMDQGFKGKMDVEGASMEIGKFAQTISGTTVDLDAFKGSVTQATEALGNLANSMAKGGSSMMGNMVQGAKSLLFNSFDSGSKLGSTTSNNGYKVQVKGME